MSGQNAHLERRWEFAGPVAQAYEFDQSLVSICVGPTGGGKTTVSARRCFRAALWQHPSPRDGVRRARGYVVCPTYRIAWDSVIPSYLKVMDRPWGEWRGAKGDPADHLVKTEIQGVGKVELEVKFRAVQDMDLDEFFRGKECTFFWFPEFDTHKSRDVLSYALNRVGRFPEPDDRPLNPETAAYAGVFGDANAPIIGSWFHEDFYATVKKGQTLHQQPPGFDPTSPDGFHPKAENAGNLRKINPRYYANMAERMDPADVARLLQCKPGYGRHGQPVHQVFDPTEHVAAGALEPNPEELVIIGADAGLTPAAAFLQCSMFGHWRQLAEISVQQGQMDVIEFARAIRFVLNTRFARCKKAVLVVDPAARAKSALNRNLNWAQVLQAEAGIEVRLAPSNDPKMRRDGLDRALKRRKGFLVDPSCVKTITALVGGFHYRKQQGGKLSLQPEKNEHSHIAEALEYGVLGYDGLEGRGGQILRADGGAWTPPEVVLG